MNTKFKGRLLIVDDDETVRSYYQKSLEFFGFQTDVAANIDELKSKIRSISYDTILLDLDLGGESGYEGLAVLLREAPYTKVYVLTSDGTVGKAVEAMQRGATGFFEKGVKIEELAATIEAVKPVFEVAENDLASMGLVGKSPALMKLIETIHRLSNVDSTVLILGESGTGKEVVARAIHRLSKRKSQRFDAINCGAIPENLLESELFGHKRGAFTDAKCDRKGIFELCSAGTLLLDEIGDMPLGLQMKLLRVLQEREVTPVGSSERVKVDTRVIAATHHDILQEARVKRFREDLYFRLSIIVLHIPPLRERAEDIPLLVQHFLNSCNKRFDRHVLMPSAGVMSRLQAYPWPGNVRELQNAIERAVVLAKSDEIEVKDMFAHLVADNPIDYEDAEEKNSGFFDEKLFELSLTQAKQAFEKIYLERQLQRCKGHVTEVAERSGRYRADVYRLMNRYGLDQEQFRRDGKNAPHS